MKMKMQFGKREFKKYCEELVIEYEGNNMRNDNAVCNCLTKIVNAKRLEMKYERMHRNDEAICCTNALRCDMTPSESVCDVTCSK